MPPDVSVIVPARDAGATLHRALAALAAQDFAGDVEVVVVDDASAVPVAAPHARVVRLDAQAGPAGARNAGLAATAAPLVAFTDADCEPGPGWVSALVAALADHDLVQGPVAPARPPGPYDRTLSVPGPSPRFETANLGVRRALAERLGGFERPGFVTRGHFGEDAVFGWRARRAGARVGFAPGALVRHTVVARDARGYLAEPWRARLFPHLVRELPELRGALAMRVFLSRRSASFDLALAGLALAAGTRRRWPLAAALPYARGRAYAPRQLHRPAVLRVNAVYVLADAITLAALVRGSLGARRLVL